MHSSSSVPSSAVKPVQARLCPCTILTGSKDSWDALKTVNVCLIDNSWIDITINT